MTESPRFTCAGSLSRRRFLEETTFALAVVAACKSLSAQAPPTAQAAAFPARGGTTRLGEHLLVHRGPVNVGIICEGGRAFLIDCSAGLSAALREAGIMRVERIVFTHHHRDQCCGAQALAAAGSRIGVPAAERDLFADPLAYWNDDRSLWRVYQAFRPDHLTLAEPLRVDDALEDGNELHFGRAVIRVLDTPGHTDGGISYLVEVDGRKVVFCGDCIYDEGRVWDVYSLQKGFSRGGQQIGGYHGFMGDRWRLVESLGRIRSLGADMLVPSHGILIKDPAKAIDTLVERFERCYENYVAISALRHYFPKLFTDYAGRPGQMPVRPGIAPPDCLRHFGTTWMLVSETGAAFVMDVGSPSIVEDIKKRLAQGEIRRVEGLWVTHYHFDHTDGILAFQREFSCPCITDRRLAEVLTDPAAWRLPCLAPEPIRVHQPMEDGQSWSWHEFKMTSFFYPGQTRYHSALLVAGKGLRMLFVGDSHTMSGIDDYCAHNRNWLGRGTGFQYCLSLIEKLEPTHIFNCHVNDAFTFTPEEIRFMRDNLDERERMFGRLFPWDHANYGMDGSWVRCQPYLQKAAAGARVRVKVVVTNHSAAVQHTMCRAVLPQAMGGSTTGWVAADVPARVEGALNLDWTVPASVAPGRHVVPIDIRHGGWDLPQFAESVVEV